MLNGDEIAFRSLYDQFYNYLMVVGLRYMRDKLRVEDVINDLFLDLWKREEEIQITIAVKSYLRGAMINKCLSVLRKESKMDWVDEHRDLAIKTSDSIENKLEGKELKTILTKAIDALPDKCKQVFKLSREEGLSHKEIASKLDISTKTIENHMSRALKGIRAELNKHGILFLLIYLILFK